MEFKIEVTGIKDVNSYIMKLAPNVLNNIQENSITFMKMVQRSAKLRAPRWSYGLRDSIKIDYSKSQIHGEKKGEMVLSANSPYAMFQEGGFKPHFVYGKTLTRNGGLQVMDWAGTKGGRMMGDNDLIWVSGFHPFMMPAFEVTIARLTPLLNQATGKAVKS